MALTHLDRLEAESIHILREVVATCRRPVFLYSIGKDSSVMLHLALKAFAPAPPPFPFLHIASGWDFQAMLAHRDAMASRYGLDLKVWHNAAAGLSPFDTPTPTYTRVMLTEALREALKAGGYDAAFGGGRRDEEKARAKERIFSFRGQGGGWDPKLQRPELWNNYNARVHAGESIRVFPLSNWTERDIWDYIAREAVPIVPLYLAAERPTVMRDGTLLMVDDPARFPGIEREEVVTRRVRFRTMGCWPLTGAMESEADSLDKVLAEMAALRTSERQGRVIDRDESASMEVKKREGYF
ncbi:sulfate adenylyltransferase subunit 2 [Sphingomonas astaxanthinifaciens DSM 22298]|uniref:Sulfate adenylyltransferase subunit 2 n=2 Tax=Sphingomonas TaxID=13687 RepID=A0ABQ5Z4A2_9SPHN|nr:sulfate adenylyltransferase subunit 2 [Sphingomonas astaxanthinifaciens DSM 22298]